jgi:prophage antirepressor-like protein
MDANPNPTITPFLFEGESLVRTVLLDGAPWFVAVDVCRVLGIQQATRAVENLDEDEKGVTTTHTLGGPQELLTVSESGLYALIFRSRKPAAVRFRKWVTGEVLPALRGEGRYEMGGVGHKAEVIPPPPVMERRAFPDWPLDELRTKKGTVDMYRLLYGHMAGQWIAPQLGFPVPPPELVEHGRQYTLVLTPAEGAD